MDSKFFKFFGLFGILCSSQVFAAEGGMAHVVNWYALILDSFGLHFEDPVQAEWLAVPGGLMVMAILFILGKSYQSYVGRFKEDVTPESRWSLNYFIHNLLEYIHDLSKDLIGIQFRAYLPLMAAIFLFVLVGNLKGLVPGMSPPTGYVSANLAIGLIAFVYYNRAGIKEHGWAYIKQFTGPFLALAPLFIVIEIVSHMARPLSLAMRLLFNVFADHMLLDIFTNLTYLLVPAVLLFIGLLVAFVQSFVFTLLTGIYISLAVSHDH